MALHEGSYTWMIEDAKLLNKIMNAINGDYFISDVFSIGELNWQMGISPNGYKQDDMGSFMIYIKLISLPTDWQCVIISRSTQSPQTKLSYTCIITYNESGLSYGGGSNCLRFEEIKELNLGKLVFVIKIRILRIILKNNNELIYNYKFNYIKHQKLTWNLDKETLILAKKAYNGKSFESDIFNDMWCIRLHPNGDVNDRNGQCILRLQLCAFRSNVCSVDVQWHLSIQQLNFKETETSIKTNVLTESDWLNVGSFSDFNKCSEFSVIIDVLILKEYDSNNKEIEIKSISKWDNYIQEEKKDNNSFNKEINVKIDSLSTNIQQILRLNQEKDEQIKLLKQEIKSLNDNNKQYKQEINYQMTLYDAKIKSINDRIAQIFEEEKKENENNNNNKNIFNEINKLKQEINKIKSHININDDNINQLSNFEKLKLFFETELCLPEYLDAIIDSGFENIESLYDLTSEDLKEMNVKIAHRKKILKAIQQKQAKSSQV